MFLPFLRFYVARGGELIILVFALVSELFLVSYVFVLSFYLGVLYYNNDLCFGRQRTTSAHVHGEILCWLFPHFLWGNVVSRVPYVCRICKVRAVYISRVCVTSRRRHVVFSGTRCRYGMPHFPHFQIISLFPLVFVIPPKPYLDLRKERLSLLVGWRGGSYSCHCSIIGRYLSIMSRRAIGAISLTLFGHPPYLYSGYATLGNVMGMYGHSADPVVVSGCISLCFPLFLWCYHMSYSRIPPQFLTPKKIAMLIPHGLVFADLGIVRGRDAPSPVWIARFVEFHFPKMAINTSPFVSSLL